MTLIIAIEAAVLTAPPAALPASPSPTASMRRGGLGAESAWEEFNVLANIANIIPNYTVLPQHVLSARRATQRLSRAGFSALSSSSRHPTLDLGNALV